MIGWLTKYFAQNFVQQQPAPARPDLTELSVASLNQLLFGRATAPTLIYNPSELISRKGYRLIEQMRRDDQIKAALALKKHAVLATGWDIDSEDGGEDEVSEFVENVFHKMRGSIDRKILSMLSALDYGFSVSELLWEERDGKVVLADIKTRYPEPFTFELSPGGDIVKLSQAEKPLPVEKFIVYSYEREFDNPYGKSDLEAAYNPWWGKYNASIWLSMLLEKLGIPPIFALYNSAAFVETDKAALKKVLENLQAATVGSIPRGKNKDDLEMWAPELADNAQNVFLPALEAYDRRIAKALLMPGLLGITSDSTEGSLARAEVHFDVFMLVVEKLRREIAEEVINEQIIKPLVDFNFSVDQYPSFKFNPLTSELRTDILKAWTDMVGVNVVTRQTNDESHIRGLLGFPEYDAGDAVEMPKEPAVEFAFDPAQPRDDAGRWAGGGGSGGKVPSYVKSLKPEIYDEKVVDKYVKQLRAGKNLEPILVARDAVYDEGVGIVDGNHRLAAYRKVGKPPVAVEVPRIPALQLLASGASPTEVATKLGNYSKSTQQEFAQKDKAAVYKQITKDMDAVTKDALVALVSALGETKGKLREYIRSKYDGSPKFIDMIQLRGKSAVQSAISELLSVAYERGRAQLRTELPKTFAAKRVSGFKPKEALQYLQQKAITSAATVNDKLLGEVKQALLQSVKQGESAGQAADRVDAIFDPWIGSGIVDEDIAEAPNYAETLVRTNLTDAYNQGRLMELRDPDLQGFISGVRYSAIIDTRTTPICDFLHEKIFRADDPDLDKFTPPNHFNCRSILEPVLIDESVGLDDYITEAEKGHAHSLAPERFV